MSFETPPLQVEKNNHYRNKYRQTMKWLVTAMVICTGLTTILVMMSFITLQPNYYGSTATGDNVPLHSLSEPCDYAIGFSSVGKCCSKKCL